MTSLPLMFLILNAASQVTPASEDWQWDRDTPVCRLRQQISPSGGVIEITRTPGNEETEVTITSPPPSTVHDGEFRDGGISLYPGGKVVGDVTSYVDDAKRLHTYAVTQDAGFMEKFPSASALEISHAKISAVRAPIRSASAAAVALQSCEDQKMREWGVDPLAWRGLKTRPIPLIPVRRKFSNLDYPGEAIMERIEGDAVVRLAVGPDGGVKRCESVNSGGYKGFENAACDVLKRAKFHPALGSTGESVSGFYVFDVRFRLAH